MPFRTLPPLLRILILLGILAVEGLDCGIAWAQPVESLTQAVSGLPRAAEMAHWSDSRLSGVLQQARMVAHRAQGCLRKKAAQQQELAADTKLLGPVAPHEPALLQTERGHLEARARALATEKGVCEVALLQARQTEHRAQRWIMAHPLPKPVSPPTWTTPDPHWLRALWQAPAGGWRTGWNRIAQDVLQLTPPRLRGWLGALLVGILLAWALRRELPPRPAHQWGSRMIRVLRRNLWGLSSLAAWAVTIQAQSLAHTEWGPLSLSLFLAALAYAVVQLRFPEESWLFRAGIGLGLAGIVGWYLLPRLAFLAPITLGLVSLSETLAAVGLLISIWSVILRRPKTGWHRGASALATVALGGLAGLPWLAYPRLALLIWPILLVTAGGLLLGDLLTRAELSWLEQRPSPSVAGWVMAPTWVLTWLASLTAIVFLVPLPAAAKQALQSALVHGFTIGSISIAPLRWGAALLSAMLLIGLNRVANQALDRSPGFARFLAAGSRHTLLALLRYLGVALALLLAIAVAGLGFHNVALVAGALSVGIGFGLQNVVANFIAGLVLLFERPVKPGDWIAVNGREGYVHRVSFRATVLRAQDGSEIFVPNSEMLATPVTNWMHSDTQARLELFLGVSYQADPGQVEELLLAITAEDPDLLHAEGFAPQVLLLRFGAYTLDFVLRVHLHDVTRRYTVSSRIHRRILQEFREAGIDFPYPRQTVDLTLTASPGPLETLAHARLEQP